MVGRVKPSCATLRCNIMHMLFILLIQPGARERPRRELFFAIPGRGPFVYSPDLTPNPSPKRRGEQVSQDIIRPSLEASAAKPWSHCISGVTQAASLRHKTKMWKTQHESRCCC
jgi:hypothetical protein